MGVAAARSKAGVGGIATMFFAGTRTSSASPPKSSSPIIPSSVCGFSETRSPTARPSTSAPTAAISPAMSPPGMKGIGTGKPGMPRRTKMSRWLSAQARTRATPSPGPHSGSGQSR